MTIHEENPSPLMKKGWDKMKIMEVKCDFCDKEIEPGAFFELRTCDSSVTLDVCTRCMAVLGDEVRKRRMKE